MKFRVGDLIPRLKATWRQLPKRQQRVVKITGGIVLGILLLITFSRGSDSDKVKGTVTNFIESTVAYDVKKAADSVSVGTPKDLVYVQTQKIKNAKIAGMQVKIQDIKVEVLKQERFSAVAKATVTSLETRPGSPQAKWKHTFLFSLIKKADWQIENFAEIEAEKG